MKIESIHLRNFKRFTDLKIQNIPATAKLVVLLGPNGCGKSSLFEAFHYESLGYTGGRLDNPDYYRKIRGMAHRFAIAFHDAGPSEKSFYIRTAYRNQPHIIIPEAGVQQINQQIQPSTMERRFNTMIDNDETVFSNFQRLTSNAYRELIKQIAEEENRSKNVGQLRDEILGMFTEIQEAMRRLFTDLVLNDLDIHLKSESKGLTFDKGTSRDLPYGNLSGGEKAAFDLLFDIFIKREEYDDTVFCIDEPEAHMNPRLQGKLLEELFHFVNDKSQLWIATHAIGMMRKALQLHEQYKEQVVFLDFTDGNFDDSEVIEPTKPDRRFWEQTHEIALDDLATLVAPDQIVICEGRHGDEGFDAECYNQIFSEEFPDTKFVSGGGKRELQNYISVVEAVTKGAKVFGLRDRDNDITRQGVDRLEKKGMKVLKRGKIENYLLDDDVLYVLCQKNEFESCQEKIAELIELRDNATDIKSATNQIRRKIIGWGVSGAGENSREFLCDTLAPLIKQGMPTYDELKKIIFDDDPADA